MKHGTVVFVALLIALAAAIGACGQGTTASKSDGAEVGQFAKNADGYSVISVQQLAQLLEKKDFELVNVHIPYEAEIPQTDQFLPFDEITDYVDDLPDKNAPIVLYCRSGSMSATAAKDLAQQGYTNVIDVDGGFKAWKAAGYELLDNR